MEGVGAMRWLVALIFAAYMTLLAWATLVGVRHPQPKEWVKLCKYVVDVELNPFNPKEMSMNLDVDACYRVKFSGRA